MDDEESGMSLRSVLSPACRLWVEDEALGGVADMFRGVDTGVAPMLGVDFMVAAAAEEEEEEEVVGGVGMGMAVVEEGVVGVAA